MNDNRYFAYQKIKSLVVIVYCISLFSCHNSSSTSGIATEEQKTVTPVTVTSCTIGLMREEIELNATSDFLAKNIVKATTNGYLEKVNIQLGQKVHKGQVLLILKGKEAENLGTSLNESDAEFHFTGDIKIPANSNGFITAIGHQQGDYVQEGDQLAEVSDAGSLVFLLQLPYELNTYLMKNKQVDLILPDGKHLKGILSSPMPVIDAASQTQSIIINAINDGSVPQNLIAKVKIVKSVKDKAISLPKSAVLTNETQQSFWIMKMIDQSTAIKVPVKTGIEANGRIEILSPVLSPDDLILNTGNYGLSDTAKVIIQQH